MLSEEQRAELRKQMQRDESKVVNIVLHDEQQVAGEVEKATRDGIYLTDGRHYPYEQIREINGLS
ncbi:hypothetical protein [Brevibacillus fulvus]|uniref:Uncharacterized protein n=1 Tax=Brevibacillus fulvus TaxID=1125967 RepID=A0A938XU28_9BACL|nr:hypothetical protein [Brevibacillus fulvus]MBM7590498.1 hypothetical protein [Brevibacillus fulvus]